jgi:hypothetical protein
MYDAAILNRLNTVSSNLRTVFTGAAQAANLPRFPGLAQGARRWEENVRSLILLGRTKGGRAMQTSAFLKIALVLSLLSILCFVLLGAANVLTCTLLFLSAMSFAVHHCAKEASRSTSDAANHL